LHRHFQCCMPSLGLILLGFSMKLLSLPKMSKSLVELLLWIWNAIFGSFLQGFDKCICISNAACCLYGWFYWGLVWNFVFGQEAEKFWFWIAFFFASISLFLFTKEREPWQALVWIGRNCTILHSTLRFRSWFCRTNGRFGCSSWNLSHGHHSSGVYSVVPLPQVCTFVSWFPAFGLCSFWSLCLLVVFA
jgi:hypothetical protein